MNEELTPLEALKEMRKYGAVLTENCEIIETALKEYEEHKQILNDYGLSLADFRHACFTFAQFKNTKGFEDVGRKLKAFKIIKEKRVNVDLLMRSNYLDVYNMQMRVYSPFHKFQELTQEEYDLLKEVLL